MVGVDETWSHDLDLNGHCLDWLQKTLHSIQTCDLLILPTLEVTGDENVSLGGPITLLEGSTGGVHVLPAAGGVVHGLHSSDRAPGQHPGLPQPGPLEPEQLPQTLQASVSEAESWWPLSPGKYGSDLFVNVLSPLRREGAREGGVVRQWMAVVQEETVLEPPGSG